MKIQALGIDINYRITVPKTDPRNVCSDTSRESGFYWTNHFCETPEEMSFVKEQGKLILEKIDTLGDIPESLKTIKLLPNTEGVKVEVSVGFEGTVAKGNSIYFNGTHRLNAKFEYFEDFK